MTGTGIATEEFKITEIGPLPQDWEVEPFDNVRVKAIGRIPPSIPVTGYQTQGKYPIIDQSANYIAGYTDDDSRVLREQLPVIIFGDHTRIFKFVNFPFAIGADGTKIIYPNSDAYNPKFLYYYFLSLDIPSRGYNRHFRILREQKIARPPLPEQKRIAYFLSTVQTAIEKTEAVIKATRELKKSLMKHLFTYGPVSIDEAENVILRETEIGLVPEEWEVVKLGEVITTQYGYTASACYDQIGPRFLRITDIDDDGNVNWSSVPYCTVSTNDYRRFSLEDGDTVVARIGATTGKAYFAVNSPRSVFASYLIRLKIKNKDKMYPAFISAFTKSVPYWTQVNQSKGEKLKSGLSARQLENMLIPLPPFQIQQRSAIALLVIEKKLETERNKKAALQALFKTLLSRLMTGRIRVNNVEVPV